MPRLISLVTVDGHEYEVCVDVKHDGRIIIVTREGDETADAHRLQIDAHGVIVSRGDNIGG